MRDVDLAARIHRAGGHPTDDAVCSAIPRKSTKPQSPVSLSPRLSMRKERLKPTLTASNDSPLRSSDSAIYFCLAT